jgi:hypothetical protein
MSIDDIEDIDFTSHLCLRGRACRATDPPAIVEAAGTLCPPCLRHLRSVVKQLPEHWLALHANIGDHAPSGDRDRRVRIRSTRTPPSPVNTARDALAAAIVEAADHAAGIISDILRRQPQPKDAYVGSRMPPGRRRDSTRFRCNEYGWLKTSVRLIEPNLELLVEHRDDDLLWTMQWPEDGGDITGAELQQVTGLAVIEQLTVLHNRARAELGKQVLRHRYSLPCPRCGGEVGRLDGEAIITCAPHLGGCGAAWTEREYKWFVGLVAREEMENVTNWLLAEAYWRLDQMQNITDTLQAMPDVINQAGAGDIILAELQKRLSDHVRPAVRDASTHGDATARQDADEQWEWANEPRYKRPRRKAVRKAGPVDHPIAVVSRSTVSEDPDYTGTETVDRAKLCHCNTVHAGEC